MKINTFQLLCCKEWIRFARLFVFIIGLVFLSASNFPAQVSVPGKSSSSSTALKTETTKKQTATRELPPSRVYKFIKPETSKTIHLSKLTEEQMKLSSTTQKKLQIGIVRQLEQQVSKAAQGIVFPVAGGTVWISEIVSEAAVEMRLKFNKTNLPPGAKLFVYSAKNPDDLSGPYEKSGDSENGDFWTPPFEGDGVIVEYFEPDQDVFTKYKLPFQIVKVSHIYRNPFGSVNEEMNNPTQYPCHNEIPAEWSFTAKSVAHLKFVDDVEGVEASCTGTLLTSLSGDFNPILLTANHCISTASEAQSVRAYWFYDTGDYISSNTLHSDGAILLNTGTRDVASDFTLLRIRGALPMRAGMVFSGWDSSAAIFSGTPVVGLHHPSGSHKRFSSGMINSTTGNFFEVQWNSGITEVGSSGSGIWKGTGANSRLIGTLSEGSEGCVNPSDSYGKFSVTYQYISSNLQGGSDDVYDAGNGNDLRGNAAGIGQGFFSNLVVKYTDSDWYSINVPAGYRITATAGFTHNYGDIDVALYRGNEANPVSVSESAANSETVTNTANGGATTYYLHVYLFDGARNDYNLTVNLQQTSSTSRKSFDFDGDGRADVSVFRPSNGTWYLKQPGNSFAVVQFGIPTDKLVPADYDGDGKTDIAVYRSGIWYLNRSSAGYTGVPFGEPNDVPQPADFNGDGRADLAVWRPSNGFWYVYNLVNNQYTAAQFGASTDKPVVGDYDGDGRADYAVFRPSNGTWYLQQSSRGHYSLQFGISTDKPVAADYDGDGKTDIAVYRPANGFWYQIRSLTGFTSFQFGISTDLPTPADYDGDGKTDIAVFRNGSWYLQQSTAGLSAIPFGASTDKPVPNSFVP